MPPITVRVQKDDFDIAAEVASLSAGRRDVGAVVTFSGICRDEDGRLGALELEHYPGWRKPRSAGSRPRWPSAGRSTASPSSTATASSCPGENIVLVVTASAHRQAAFDAANFLMDFLKTRAPFWKKEHGPEKTGWVEAKATDEDATDRWER